MISTKAVAAVAAAMMIVGSGVAMAKTKTASTTPVVHSPESIQCSKDADEKGLKGKDRKKFRADCIKAAKKAAATTAKKPDDKPATDDKKKS